MRKVYEFLHKHAADYFLFFGLFLMIDNWGKNHPELIFAGVVLMLVGLNWFVENKITEGQDDNPL